ncbi:MAG: GTP-binding protein [Candidatus Dojkabacteria bacterium]|nr:GTP-binding protein [Candidatus Dojkabacteria bacterium]
MDNQNKSIPIIILTGFLGSGKTTLLNKIIEKYKDEYKIAVVMNEFGDVAIDSELISSSVGDEEIWTVDGGCICCVVRGDLIKGVQNLVEKANPDIIFIETSGLADPYPVAQTFFVDNLNGRVYLDSIVCLIDANNFNVYSKEFEIAYKQIYVSSFLIINKIKNLPQKKLDELHEIVKEINKDAYIIDDIENIDLNIFIDQSNISFVDLLKQEKIQNDINLDDKLNSSNVKQEESCHGHCSCNCDHDCDHKHEECKCCNSKDSDCHHHEEDDHVHPHTHEDVDQYVFTTEKLIDIQKFAEWIKESLPRNVYRAKGFLCTNEKPYKYFLLQVVGGSKDIYAIMPSRENFDYKRSRLVFIGKDLDKDYLERSLKQVLL